MSTPTPSANADASRGSAGQAESSSDRDKQRVRVEQALHRIVEKSKELLDRRVQVSATAAWLVNEQLIAANAANERLQKFTDDWAEGVFDEDNFPEALKHLDKVDKRADASYNVDNSGTFNEDGNEEDDETQLADSSSVIEDHVSDANYRAGIDKGYDIGFKEGHDTGIREGEAAGRQAGSDETWDEAWNEGYSAGCRNTAGAHRLTRSHVPLHIETQDLVMPRSSARTPSKRPAPDNPGSPQPAKRGPGRPRKTPHSKSQPPPRPPRPAAPPPPPATPAKRGPGRPRKTPQPAPQPAPQSAPPLIRLESLGIVNPVRTPGVATRSSKPALQVLPTPRKPRRSLPAHPKVGAEPAPLKLLNRVLAAANTPRAVADAAASAHDELADDPSAHTPSSPVRSTPLQDGLETDWFMQLVRASMPRGEGMEG